MIMRLLAIINPISGTGKQKGIELLLKNFLDKNRFNLQIEYTQFAGHASILAKKATHSAIDAVLAVGGDGTINEIARSLTGSDVVMGIIPCGSGNGLARHLGIPMNTKKAIQRLNRSEIKSVDTVKANDKIFVNVGGIGFDARISHEFEKMESRGFVSYFKAVAKSYQSYEEKKFTIETNERKIERYGFLLSFANSSQFGNNAYIAPKASISDGEINLVLLRKPKLYQIPSLAIRMFTKRLHKSSLVTEIKGSEFHVTQESIIGHVDGEAIEFGNHIDLKVMQSSLKIFSNN